MDVNGKQVVVLGLGISGMDVATLLQDKGARVTVRDGAAYNAKVAARAGTLRARGISVELGDQVSTTAAFDFFVLSPGIAIDSPLARGLHASCMPILGELEVAYRFCQCPIVAITGTNGKS